MTNKEAIEILKCIPKGINVEGNLESVNKWFKAIAIAEGALEELCRKEGEYNE